MRRASLTAALVSVALLASGCSTVEDLFSPEAPAPSWSPQQPPAGMEGMDGFYEQRLQWEKCSGGQCAQLEVPLSYAEPHGDTIEVDLELDTAPREVDVPADFAAALDAAPVAKRAFEALSYSNKRRYTLSIEDAKSAETRQRRIEKSVRELEGAAR